MIELEHVTKRYWGNTALDDVTILPARENNRPYRRKREW